MKPLLTLQTDFPLQTLNTFGIASRAERYLTLQDNAQLQILHQMPELLQMPRTVLGGGSNVILPARIPGLVLKMDMRGRACVGETAEAILVRAAAGENWHEFVQWTLANGWGGLENLSLIPGTVGAAPIQNIGAYGMEMQDCFLSLQAFDFASGEIIELDKASCRFAYRDSIFKQAYRDRLLILNVTFALPKLWQPRKNYADVAAYLAQHAISEPQAQDIANAIIAIRRAKLPDPQVIGNAGSFFKNPIVSADQRNSLLAHYPKLVSYTQPDGRYKLAAGWLIEQSGWKGRALGPVASYEKQALVLVNQGGATGLDVATIAHRIQSDVQQQFAVTLEIEPVFVQFA